MSGGTKPKNKPVMEKQPERSPSREDPIDAKANATEEELDLGSRDLIQLSLLGNVSHFHRAKSAQMKRFGLVRT